MRGLRMALDDWHAGLGDTLPALLAAALIETRDNEFVLGLVEHRANVSVEADPELRIGRTADRAGDAHVVAPHDRARVSEPGNGNTPFQRRLVRDAPCVRQRLGRIIHAACGNAAKAWPVHAGAWG